MPVLKSFADGRLFGGSWGSGPATALALHGWRRDHRDFARVFGEAESGAPSALAPDLFGFGATPPPPEPWGTDEYARELLGLFEEPGLLADRIVLVGHSFGGRVAVRLYPLVPDRIERMVLTGVPLLDRAGRRARPPAGYRALRLAHRVGLVGDARLEAARRRHGSADYRAAEGVMRAVFVRVLAEDYAQELGSIGCPVDLVWGQHDNEVPLEVALRARALFPSATLRTLPGIGHLTPTEAPEALRDAVTGGPASSGSTAPGGVIADPTRRAP
jgi:pimeloyl-ACP methyl ester carboxylesterase